MALPPQPGPKTNPRPFYIHVYQETHPFYTCGDLVRGIVRVEPTLRPQRITIVFRGWSVIFDQDANGASPSFFNYKHTLFESSGAHENFDILRRGTASDGKVDLPFEFTFPHNAWMAPPSDREWRRDGDTSHHPRFQYSPGFLLPPSCTVFASPRGPMPAKIKYGLEASLESVFVDNGKIAARHELKFIPPAPEHDLSLLEPNVERSISLPKHAKSSKLGKVKDLLVEKELFFGLQSFTEIPFAKFNLRSASLPDPPNVFMRRIRIQLMPAYNVLIPRPAINAHVTKELVEISRETWTLLDKKFDEGPGQPLFNGLQLADIGGPLLAHNKLLPSFSSYGVNLEYEMQVEIWGECVKHEFSGLACRTEVQIVSGWNASPPPPINLTDTDGSIPMEPVYQEVDPMMALHDLNPEARGTNSDNGIPAYESVTPSIALRETNSRELPPPYMG
ncbi:hypothetical protein DE146DRAFT_605552 [Phaeosphaeria sp. MPI-PUGE-AT-0046c]|nr:hypothetical protein DE146DRAFT_605552 [Phaeosphaeria sp. MPI-PUGE-AT-0046c]